MPGERSITRSKVVDATLRLIDKYTGPLQKAAEQTKHQVGYMKRQANQIKSVGKSVESVGTSLQKGVTAPILGALGASGKLADTFEKDMSQVNTLLDNKEHLENYKKTAVQVSNDTGIALGTVSKGVYQMISSIGDSGKKTQDIFTISAKAAKGGGSSVAESVALISSAMKGYDSVNAKTAQSISDMAFQTQKLGVTTYKELAASMQPLFPLGNSLSVSYQELFGSMATLTGVTGNTAEVTTQLKGLFTGLLKPTDAMKNLLAKYGYENGQAMIKAKGMSGVLQILKKETGGQSNKMAELFSNSRALTAALALTGAQYDTFNEKTKKMSQASGSTDKALKDMKTSTSEIRKAINSAKNSLTVFGVSVLKVVAPPITKTATKLSEFAKKFSDMSPETQKFIVKMALVAAAVGPTIAIIGKLTKGVGSLAGNMVGLYQKFSKAGSITAFIGPGGKIALILAAIAIAAVLVYKNWDKITAGAKKLQKAVVKAMNDAGVDTKQLGKTANEIGTMASESFGKIGKAGAAIVKALQPVISFMKGAFKLVFSTVFKFIVAKLSGWLKTTLDTVQSVTTAFNGVIKFIEGVFTGNWKKAWSGVVDIFTGIFGAIGGRVKRPLNEAIGLINTAISGINGIKIPSWVPGIGGKGVNIPKIPMLAKGTLKWAGGLAQVHEKGGELIDLPRGTRVYPHDESIRKAREDGNKTIKIEKFADTIIVREEADIDKIARKLVEKLEAIPV